MDTWWLKVGEERLVCPVLSSFLPAHWVSLCRFIGSRSKVEFDSIVKMVKGRMESGAVSAVKKGHLMPLVSIGPSGIGGEWQWEVG